MSTKPAAAQLTCRTTSSCDGGADQKKTVTDYLSNQNLVPSYSSQGSGDNLLTAVTSYTYDLYGNVTVVDGPLPGSIDQSISSYDTARQLIGVIGPDPDGSGPLKNRAIRYDRNGNGWVTAVSRGTVNSYTDPLSSMTILQRTEAAYDALGRVTLTGVRDPSTNVMLMMTQTGYDALSRIQCTAIRMNPSIYGSLPGDACALGANGSYGPDRITKTSYDAIGHVIDVQQAYGTSDQIDYARTTAFSDNGKPLNLIDANGNATAFTYDPFDRPQSTHYPSPSGGGSSTSDFEQVLAYDANSNATSYRLRDGNTIAMTYDALNRLTGRTGATITGRSFQYDNQGEMTAAIINGGSNLTFGFDALGRMTTETSPIGTFTHGYDLAGRQTHLTWPDGFAITYNRFYTGEIGNLQEDATGFHPLAMAYDDLGLRTIFAPANGHTTTYHHDGAGRLDAFSLAGLPGGTTSTWLNYNPANQIWGRQTSDEQLSANVAYNVNRNYAVNGLNQYTHAGSPGLGYDGLGNLTRLASTTYAYDGDNLLVGGSAGAGLSYDPLTRLAQVPDAGGTRFGYAGGMIAAEYDTSGAIQHRYVPGDLPDEVLVQYEGSAYSRRYLATDERGSVTEVSDDSDVTLAVNTYDDWGIPARNNFGRYGYTGQTWLPSVQAWNYKARIYSPLLGRFQQSDPLGVTGGLSYYNYASNDPIGSVDSSGEAPMTATQISTAKTMFHSLIDYSKVDMEFSTFNPVVAALNYKGHAVTVDNTIYFPAYMKDSPSFNGYLMHELTHVFQYQVLGASWADQLMSLTACFAAVSDLCYNWQAGEGFNYQNWEAQAQAVQNCYSGGKDACRELSSNTYGITSGINGSMAGDNGFTVNFTNAGIDSSGKVVVNSSSSASVTYNGNTWNLTISPDGAVTVMLTGSLIPKVVVPANVKHS